MISGPGVPMMATFPVDDPDAGLVVLRECHRIFSAPGSWAGARSHARDRNGNECHTGAAGAVMFAAGAALVRAQNELGLDVWAGIYAQRLFARATGMTPVEFNRSCRNRAEVVAAFARAIRIGEKLKSESINDRQKVG